MKKILLSALALFIVVGCCQKADALGWDTIAGMSKENVKPTHEYKLDTSGYSPRVYEWTPKDNKNITCVFVAAERKGGVACYPKNNSVKR